MTPLNGEVVVFQETLGDLVEFDPPDELAVGAGKGEVVSGEIFEDNLALEVVRIRFYCVQQGGGKHARDPDFGGKEVFREDGGQGAVVLPDVLEGGVPAGRARMVIDNDIGFPRPQGVAEEGRLGIDDGDEGI